jgi:ArsR family transcriptional regulator
MPIDRVTVFKALADENRLRIVETLAGAGETCACELLDELAVTQPTLSHHMKVLCDCGLVACRREGRWCHYSVVPEAALRLAAFFSTIADERKEPRPEAGVGASCGCVR